MKKSVLSAALMAAVVPSMAQASGLSCDGFVGAVICLSASTTMATVDAVEASRRATTELSDFTSSKDDDENEDARIRINVAALVDQAYAGYGHELSLVADKLGEIPMDLADVIVRISRENRELVSDVPKFAPVLASELATEYGLD